MNARFSSTLERCPTLHITPFRAPEMSILTSLPSKLIQNCCVSPGEKDHVNTWLARVLVGTTRISAEIRVILTVQRPVTPKRAGASGSKINDDSVSTFKQACSGRYSGSLKLSSRRFERAHNRSAPLLILFSIAPEVNGLGRYRAVICAKFGIKSAYFQQ